MSLKAMGWLQNSLGIDVTGEMSQLININVGGIIYTCRKGTLANLKENPVFAPMLAGRAPKNADGCFHIDRDGTIFRHVLNYIRSGSLLLPETFDEWELLLDDARFYQLKEMEEEIVNRFEYQRVLFFRSLPQAVYVYWSRRPSEQANAPQHPSHSHSNPRVMIVPALPALTVSQETGEVKYQGSVLQSLDELITTLLASYGFVIQHWIESEGKVFLTLPTKTGGQS